MRYNKKTQKRAFLVINQRQTHLKTLIQTKKTFSPKIQVEYSANCTFVYLYFYI